eukprot:TRINITY_DN5330_c7_g1_i1.p1 TRINITY_DN5330_c7_g1~~TRINITY_DN5330_c7_g1_i1.p1  ORF type:complete len:1427 (+),score=502.44 TRINITY_DN5330_c7_g1_i1:1127-5407(+)
MRAGSASPRAASHRGGLKGARRAGMFRVFTRIRPFLPAEIEANTKGGEKFKTDMPAVDYDYEGGQIVIKNDRHLLMSHKGPVRDKKAYPKDLQDGGKDRFSADTMCWSFSRQQDWELQKRDRDDLDVERQFVGNEEMFDKLGPQDIAADLYRGYSHLIVATGVNNTGKTHTMWGGKEEAAAGRTEFSAGIVSRFLNLLRDAIPKAMEDKAPGEEKDVRISLRFVRVYQEEVEDLFAKYPMPPLRGQKHTIQLNHSKAGKDTLAEANSVDVCGSGVGAEEWEKVQRLLWGSTSRERCRPMLADYVDEEKAGTSKDKIQEKRAHYILQVTVTQESTFRAEGEDMHGDTDEKAATSTRYADLTLVDMGWGGDKPDCHDQPTHQKTVKSALDFRNLIQKMRARADAAAREESLAADYGSPPPPSSNRGGGSQRPAVTFSTKLALALETSLGSGDGQGMSGHAGAFTTMIVTLSPWHGQKGGTGVALDLACNGKHIRCSAAPHQDKTLQRFQEAAHEQDRILKAKAAKMQEMQQVQSDMRERQQQINTLHYEGKIQGMREWVLKCWIADCEVRQRELTVGLQDLEVSPDERKRRCAERMQQASWPKEVYPTWAGPHDPWAGFDKQCKYTGKKPRYPGDPGKYPLAMPLWGKPEPKVFLKVKRLEDMGVVLTGDEPAEFPETHSRSLMVRRDPSSYETGDGETVFFNGALRRADGDRNRAFGIKAEPTTWPAGATSPGPGVIPGGAADKAGVREGMFVLKIDGSPVSSLAELRAAFEEGGSHVVMFGMLVHKDRPDYLGKDGQETGHDFPDTLRGVLMHLGAGAIRGCQGERDELKKLEEKIRKLTGEAEAISASRKRQTQSMEAEVKQAGDNEEYIQSLDVMMSELESHAMALQIPLQDDDADEADVKGCDMVGTSEEAAAAREGIRAGIEARNKKLGQLVGQNKGVQTIGKAIAEAISQQKKDEQARKMQLVKFKGAMRAAVGVVVSELDEFRINRDALEKAVKDGGAPAPTDVRVFATGGVKLVWAPTPSSAAAPVLWKAEPRLSESVARAPDNEVVTEPPGVQLSGRCVTHINGQVVGTDPQSLAAGSEPSPDESGHVTLTLAPVDAAYTQHWRGMWDEVLHAAGSRVEGGMDIADSRSQSQQDAAKGKGKKLDELFLAKADGMWTSYFANCDDGVTDLQKAHNKKLKEAAEKLAGAPAKRVPGCCNQLVAAVDSAAGGERHSDPMGGCDWEAALKRAASRMSSQVDKLEKWETARLDQGDAPQSPDLSNTKISVSTDDDAKVQAHYNVKDLSLEEIEEMCALAQDLRQISHALLCLCESRRGLERAWEDNLWKFAKMVRLDGLRDEVDGHLAGKGLADAINGISKHHRQAVSDQAAVGDMTERVAGDRKAASEAESGVAALTSAVSTKTAAEKKLDEQVKKQCCTIL